MKKTTIVIALLIVTSLAALVLRGQYQSYQERRATTEAIKRVMSMDEIAAIFPQPHTTATVYQFRYPFFDETFPGDPSEQINNFVSENTDKEAFPVNAIYRGTGRYRDTFFDVSLNVCGSSFCRIEPADLFETPRHSAQPFILAPTRLDRDKTNPDALQRREIYSANILGKTYLFYADLRRTNSGEIADATLIMQRPASRFESFLEQMSANIGDVSVLKTTVFYHDYALGWSLHLD